MEIVKVMRVESAVGLYRILDRDRSVFESCDDEVVASRLGLLCDYAAEYLYGCKCDEDSNWARMDREYRELIGDDAVHNRLKEFYGRDRVDFVLL